MRVEEAQIRMGPIFRSGWLWQIRVVGRRDPLSSKRVRALVGAHGNIVPNRVRNWPRSKPLMTPSPLRSR